MPMIIVTLKVYQFNIVPTPILTYNIKIPIMIRIIGIVPLSEATVVFGVIVKTFLVFTLYFVVVVSEGPVFGFLASEVVPIF